LNPTSGPHHTATRNQDRSCRQRRQSIRSRRTRRWRSYQFPVRDHSHPASDHFCHEILPVHLSLVCQGFQGYPRSGIALTPNLHPLLGCAIPFRWRLGLRSGHLVSKPFKFGYVRDSRWAAGEDFHLICYGFEHVHVNVNTRYFVNTKNLLGWRYNLINSGLGSVKVFSRMWIPYSP